MHRQRARAYECASFYTAITCSALSSVSDGAISYDQGRVPDPYPYGTAATYSCNPGFYLQGDPSRVCEGSSVSGTWRGVAPVCMGMLYTTRM